ncbi:hypothetical protein H2200_012750 [Cladophialophora chaetospira]|uniref:PHD-type domain-containing protein n=1 Tax=Cladophialophora chaetospira TaxID=386627 RepID=A0AA38WXJ8_9EURO|nr:hypothetical protein H2200_012750 [Cladophialophora chaetospira]
MSPDSTARRGRPSKRRKFDVDPHEPARSDSPKVVAEQAPGSSLSATPAQEAQPVVRPPDAPFRPGQIELWVCRDGEGKKQLTSEMVPGCRHWRMGDPNVPYCFECKKEEDVLGCRTCKRSYHAACLGDHAPAEPTSTNIFYCPVCVERGWDVQPPADILPLTPASSREPSPKPPSSWAEHALNSRLELDLIQLGRKGREAKAGQHNDGNSVQRSFIAVNKPTTGPITTRPADVASTARAETPAAAFMRTYDLQPPAATSTGRQVGNMERPAGVARPGNRSKSRYQTMPDEVDQALTVIYRELEGVTALRQDLAALQDRVKAAEQARKILEGQLALQRTGHEAIARRDAEIESLKRQLIESRTAHDSVMQENNQLKQRMQDEETTNKEGLEEMQALKASLRRLLGEG